MGGLKQTKYNQLYISKKEIKLWLCQRNYNTEIGKTNQVAITAAKLNIKRGETNIIAF